MKLLAPIKDRLDAVNKGYVDDTADEKVGELRESVAKDLNTLREDLTEVEKGTIKEITSPCHIAELEKGIYIVKNNLVGGYSGQVTFSNVTTDKTINDSYFMLDVGLLIVHENIKQKEADGTETSIIGFTAQGTIGVPNKSYSGDVPGSPIEIETVESATSVQCYMLESTKFAESTAPYEANKWYSTMPGLVLSDIPASAIKNEITTESTIYDVPSALAVKNFGETIKTELLANIGNKADKTEVETALSGKVNKSDILSNIDKNAQPEDIYNAPVVNTAIAALEQGTIKALPSGTVNLWELESGLYRVSSGVTINASQTEILPKPAKPYSYLYVSGESYTGSTDKRYIVGWAYLVSTSYDNRYAAKVFTGATYTNGIARETATEIATVTKLNNLENRLDTKLETALMGKVDKSDILTEVVTDEVYTDNQFYNANAINSLVNILGEDFVTNNKFDRIVAEVANQFQTKVDKNNILTEIDYDASADNIYNAIVINSITQQINETFATKDYVNKAMLELFDGEDYTDAYAVLSKNPLNMLKYIGNMIGVIEN